MRSFCIVILALFAGRCTAAPATSATAASALLRARCAPCHNEKSASGGLNVTALLDPATLRTAREPWEKIVQRVRAGEMPPKGTPPLDEAAVAAFVKHIESEFDRIDRLTPLNPGRVTARRLNRVEYTNTIRDLLGVEFSANDEFPPDDSGYGFDNIGDVLTVSPTLLHKYLQAAERIASRVVGADPLPKPGLFNKRAKVRRLATGVIEVKDQIDYDAEYDVRALITGHRGTEGKPVTLQISIDGKPVKTVEVSSAFTLVNRQGGATQRTFEQVRLFLPQGIHTLRAEFLNDETGAKLTGPARFNPGQNIFPESFEIAGPFPATSVPESRRQLLLCDPATGLDCVTRIFTRLARKAYRGPVTAAEVSKLVAVHKRALDAGYQPGQSLQFAIAAMLVSPRFLFRLERSPAPGTVARLTPVELASRLSYFLWSSMPDDELLTLAESGRLAQPAILDAQWKRMLASPKSIALADNFASQWLETRSLDAAKPDPQKFPMWNPDLRESMRTETRLFFDYVLRDNRPITEFLNARYTFLNEQMAAHYGIEGVKGPDFRKVELSSVQSGGDQRGGILSHASVLTVSSYPTRTSVVLRGKYLLENILGAPPPAPPPDVPALDEAAVGAKQSLRQQMEQHRTNSLCASCHARMDTLGFGLENYDALGMWRTQDGNFPVDASGTFPNGKSFSKPSEMKDLLQANPIEFSRCLTEKLFTYALGRGVEPHDRPVIRQIVRQLSENDYKFQTLIAGIVRSLPFQARRTELTAQPSQPKPVTEPKTTKETAAK